MKKHIPLSNLEINKKAKITNINCNDSEKRRFLDLGIVKDTIITPLFDSPFGTPTAYEIRNTVIAIRKENANKIEVVEI